MDWAALGAVSTAIAAIVGAVIGYGYSSARIRLAEAEASMATATANHEYAQMAQDAWRLVRIHEDRWRLAEPILRRCADEVPELRVLTAQLAFSIKVENGGSKHG